MVIRVPMICTVVLGAALTVSLLTVSSSAAESIDDPSTTRYGYVKDDGHNRKDAIQVTTRKRRKGYDIQKTFKVGEVGCLRYNISGTARYRTKTYKFSDGVRQREFRNIRFTNHKFRVTSYRYDSVKHWCSDRRLRWKKLRVKTYLTSKGCSWNPRLSASAPWGISVAVWPKCGKRKVAKAASKFGRAYTRGQEIEGRVKFGNYLGKHYHPPGEKPRPKRLCAAFVVVSIPRYYTTDYFEKSRRLRACMPFRR